MASSSGTSSGSFSLAQTSGSDEDLQALMDQRKRKRMISNRESARRSRMRKQKHLDDLVAQVTQLRKENQQILTRVNLTSQQYLAIEADNSVLKAQANELSHRLQSLNEIVDFLNATTSVNFGAMNMNMNMNMNTFIEPSNNSFLNSMAMTYLNQPIMASADMFQC